MENLNNSTFSPTAVASFFKSKNESRRSNSKYKTVSFDAQLMANRHKDTFVEDIYPQRMLFPTAPSNDDYSQMGNVRDEQGFADESKGGGTYNTEIQGGLFAPSTPNSQIRPLSSSSRGGLSIGSSWDAPTVVSNSSPGNNLKHLDDPNFAPPPVLSIPRIQPTRSFEEQLHSSTRSAHSSTRSTTLYEIPVYDKIRHSGFIMARFSVNKILAKKWRQHFWILYDQSLLFFKTSEDFEEWLMNPTLSDERRDSLVIQKLDLDDAVTPGNYVHKLGKKKVKFYRTSGNLHQFKLTKHLKFGSALTDSVEGAFASLNEIDVTELYTIIYSLVKLKPKDTTK